MNKVPRELYFMGIGGTGMASVAALAQQAGFKVSGSDKGVYPPMSNLLKELNIPVLTPYSEHNLKNGKPDLIVVANALSRGHPEVEYMLANKLPYTSFPAFLEEFILQDKLPVVVAGTHGKTTTTSLTAFILHSLNLPLGYLIGGICQDFGKSFELGPSQSFFVIEGDEYDTAFFDKGPKFLHYRPEYVILNNIEFDHADIYRSVDEIKQAFLKLLTQVKDPKNIIANIDDPHVLDLINTNHLDVTRVSTQGKNLTADIIVQDLKPPTDDFLWQAQLNMPDLSVSLEIKTHLTGPHNMANIAQVWGLIRRLWDDKKIDEPLETLSQKFCQAVMQFQGVKRRLECLVQKAGITVFEDFAHHPTSVAHVLQSLRQQFPKNRLICAFEPANATARRNIFIHEFAQSLKEADRVFIGVCPHDLRIPEGERMDTLQLAQLIGPQASYFTDNEDLLDHLTKELQPGDTVVFMSPASFSGIQHKLAEKLKAC